MGLLPCSPDPSMGALSALILRAVAEGMVAVGVVGRPPMVPIVSAGGIVSTNSIVSASGKWCRSCLELDSPQSLIFITPTS